MLPGICRSATARPPNHARSMPHSLPTSIDETQTLLSRGSYVADRSLATALFLALKLGKPLFLEGEAGVGKTEIAKVLSADARAAS